MTLIGYGRVSTQDQDFSGQVEKLKAAGCSIVRCEKVSGASRAGRTELDTILEFIRAGDELCVTHLDRLGRSTRDVLNIVHELDARGAGLRVLEPRLSTRDDLTGRVMITVLGMVAELERSFIRERQRRGIDARLEADKGRKPSERGYRGRPQVATSADVHQLAGQGMRPADIARELNISRMTVYRRLNGN